MLKEYEKEFESQGFAQDVCNSAVGIAKQLLPKDDYIEITGETLDYKYLIIAASGSVATLIKNILKEFQFDGMESETPLND